MAEFCAVLQNSKSLPFILFLSYPIALTWVVRNDPFFWDTVQLASKHAHFFYENALRWLPLPETIDSGHPPVFGYYLACIWVVFGKTLPASHGAMLPFLVLNAWMLYRLGRRLGGDRWAWWLIPLVLLDPVMAGQSVLVSPDLVLVCGFLMAVEGIFGKNKILTAAGILTLCMISTRGMMTAGAIAVWVVIRGFRVSGFQGFRVKDIALYIERISRFVSRHFLPFLPGFAFAAWFLWWHRQATGWIGLHPGSPWAPTFEPAKGLELLRNTLVIGWRWLDFGRMFEWMVLIGTIWKYRLLRWRHNTPFSENPENVWALVLLLICLTVFLSPSALLFKNVSAHRYFLPAFLALHFLVFHLLANIYVQTPALAQNRKSGIQVALFTVLLLGFALGNLWIYPRGVAMGWDATLSHLPYHRLRAEAVAYLEEKNIDFQSVGSTFPNLNTGENMMLDGDRRHFAEKDFAKNRYFFASNVFNDIDKADYEALQGKWKLLKKWRQAGVWIEIYEREQ